MSLDVKSTVLAIALFGNALEVVGEFCRSNGHSCNYPERCCGDECCVPTNYDQQYTQLRFNIWNMWYFWFAVLFTLMTCLGACGYWRRRRLFLAQERFMHQGLEHHYREATQLNVDQNRRPLLHQLVRLYPTRQGFQVQLTEGAVNTTAGEAVQGSFPSPPPYSEVISKPEEYTETLDKDSLPPYPGPPQDAVPTDATTAHYTATPRARESSPVPAEQVPGLPPYTPPQHGHTQTSSGPDGDISQRVEDSSTG